jgi:preprotein translocase subunit SecY
MVEKKELSTATRMMSIFMTIVPSILFALIAYNSYNNPHVSRKKINDTVIFFTVVSVIFLIAAVLILTLTKNKEVKKD